MERRRALEHLLAFDRLSRLDYAPDLPGRMSVDLDIYGLSDPDVLVAHITLGSTDRWLGDSASHDEDLMEALVQLMSACERRDPEACRRWQKEVCQLRSPLLDRHGYLDPPPNGLRGDEGAPRSPRRGQGFATGS
jgi:hypothetical protein